MNNPNLEQIELKGFILNSIRQCPLLQPLNPEDFDEIIRKSYAKQLPENTVLFDQGAPLTAIYLLMSGGIKLQRLAPNGDAKVIEIIRPGQTFAEAALFSGGSCYPVTSITISPSMVVAIHAETYLKLLENSNGLCLNLLAKLSQKLHWMVNEVDRLTLHNATFRLVDYLLRHIPENSNDRTGVNLVAPKHVIASRLSIKPETLSRTLKSLSKQGLINLDGSEIELVDIGKLRQLISLET